MPFFNNVYYPFEPDQAHASPVLLSTPCVSRSSTTPPSMPSSNNGTLFKFRSRHESMNWRRIGAIDVDRVANELDFVTLQENIMGITFCNIDNEQCPHCHNSLDPILVKLFRLAQFTVEYLLHSQEYLTCNLQAMEEKSRATLCEKEQIQVRMAKQSEELKSIKEECKRRKKIIATQQMQISSGAGFYHECQHCEKAFLSHSYLQNHIKRRHPEGAIFEKQSLQSSDRLLHEKKCLKEELQHTKTQMEQAAHLQRLSQIQEHEHRKTIEQEVFKKFENWKQEEKDKFEDELKTVKDELKTVKEMFMSELKELTAKNTGLENELHEMKKGSLHRKSGLGILQECPMSETEDSRSRCSHDMQNLKELLELQEDKWEKRIYQLQQEHEKEKYKLLSKIETLRLSMNEDQRTRKDPCKKRLDEFGKKLQEQNELIKTHKEQIKELSTKPPASARKNSTPTSVSSVQHMETKLSASCLREQTHTLETIEELSEEKDMDTEEATSTSKQHLINAFKEDPSLTKILRPVLEQELMEKFESLGIKPGVRGISSDHYNIILNAVEVYRKEKENHNPEIRQIREHLTRDINVKAEERASASCKLASTSQLFTDGKTPFLRSTSSTTSSLLRQTKSKNSTLKWSLEDSQTKLRYPIPTMSSTPKIKLVSSKEAQVTKPSSITTPPFSSDDESEDRDFHVDSLKRMSSLTSKGNIGFAPVQTDSDGSELEEIKSQTNIQMQPPAKPVRATLVKELTEKLEMAQSTHTGDHKPVGGFDVANVFVKKDQVMELKVSDFEDSEFDSSSLEEEKYEVPKSVKTRPETKIPKKEVHVASVKNAFYGTKQPKGDTREADTSSTLVSSLVTVSDFSDTSDV